MIWCGFMKNSQSQQPIYLYNENNYLWSIV